MLLTAQPNFSESLISLKQMLVGPFQHLWMACMKVYVLDMLRDLLNQLNCFYLISCSVPNEANIWVSINHMLEF